MRRSAPNYPRRIADSTRARDRCKSMQVKTSKKAWISLFFFGRSWTFQWVTAEKNKKLPPPNLASQVVGERERANLLSFFCRERGLIRRQRK
jgi:hypothetical protein